MGGSRRAVTENSGAVPVSPAMGCRARPPPDFEWLFRTGWTAEAGRRTDLLTLLMASLPEPAAQTGTPVPARGAGAPRQLALPPATHLHGGQIGGVVAELSAGYHNFVDERREYTVRNHVSRLF